MFLFVHNIFCVVLQTRRGCSLLCLCQIPEFLPSLAVVSIYCFVFSPSSHCRCLFDLDLCARLSRVRQALMKAISWQPVCGKTPHKAPAEWILSTSPSLMSFVFPVFSESWVDTADTVNSCVWGAGHSIGWLCPLPPPSPLSTTVTRPSPPCPIQNTVTADAPSHLKYIQIWLIPCEVCFKAKLSLSLIYMVHGLFAYYVSVTCDKDLFIIISGWFFAPEIHS